MSLSLFRRIAALVALVLTAAVLALSGFEPVIEGDGGGGSGDPPAGDIHFGW